ncbi:MAG: class I SAM-dependent methyltransferase [Myxococcales bacterium]|nr:class I SAM-dependent methyltransferase [Polyangiaceae bacterium]MDW8247766.1 class I SAM-dependent methyltransferase [Myxococcales bacterium]
MTLALGSPLSPEDVMIFHTHVAPRLRELFEERLLEPMTLEDDAVVVHLGCRTGFHDEELAARAGASSLVGVDASPEALALASRGAGAVEGRFAYYPSRLPTDLPTGAFSHAVSLHSLALQGDSWGALVGEASRLLKPGGQLLMVLPLRGSYPELMDLLREFSQASGDKAMEIAVEAVVAGRPNIEQATEHLEDAGFEDVDVSLHRLKLEYPAGQAFLDDPLMRLLFEPHLAALAPNSPEAAVDHVRRALARYWYDLPFQLSLSLGYISARR